MSDEEAYREFITEFFSGREYEFKDDIPACLDARKYAFKKEFPISDEMLFFKVFITEFNKKYAHAGI